MYSEHRNTRCRITIFDMGLLVVVLVVLKVVVLVILGVGLVVAVLVVLS